MKRIAIVFLAFIGVGLLLVALDPQRAKRAVFMATMFQGVDMTDEFSDMQSLFPFHPVRTSNPTPLATAATEFALPLTYEYQGETRNLRDFLQETDTSGLIVLRDGQVIYEEYALGSSPETRWGWSGRPVVSAPRCATTHVWVSCIEIMGAGPAGRSFLKPGSQPRLYRASPI